MPYLLNCLYLLLLALAAPRLLYAAWRHGKYRQGWTAKLWGRVPQRDAAHPCIWFHAVSVGEVNLLRPLLARAASRFPGWQFVISTTTQTGYALAQSRFPECTVFYCPLDFSWATRKAIRRVRPRMLVLVELELWPNLIRAADEAGVAVALLNGRLSERSFRGYRRIARWIRPLLARLQWIGVQNDVYAQRFLALGARAETVHVTGSVKFDGAPTDRQNPHTQRLAALAGITPDTSVLLAGSTQAPEEEMAIQAFRAARQEWPQLKLILVPRHPQRFDEVAQMLEHSGLAWQRRTRLENCSSLPDWHILLVDTVGELGAWWGTAQVAYVGGSMGSRGGQNMIEPAAYGCLVSFGPRTENFRDVVEQLLQHEAAVRVYDGQQLKELLLRAHSDPQWAHQCGHRAQQLVRSQQGAADRTMDGLARLAASQQAQPHPPHFPLRPAESRLSLK